MKKLFTLFALIGLLSFGIQNAIYADSTNTEEMQMVEEAEVDSATQAMNDSIAVAEEEAKVAAAEEQIGKEEVKPKAEKGFTQVLKDQFIDGGPGFMAIVLVCLILGLALSIERIIYLNMASTNTDKLLNGIESALASGGVDAAKEICRNTKGPVASIFYQGLDRSGEGVEAVEKSVIQYGGVQMGLLEKGLSWISLFIALAPMLGFMGTVIGMIQSFSKMETEKTTDIAVTAGGIKVALLTTVFGLIVAIILQIFYNYIISKVDSLVNEMEDSSISLVDMLVKHKVANS